MKRRKKRRGIRFSFSEDTRRNIGIVLGAGIIIALIAGGVALYERVFGDAEGTVPSATPSPLLQTPEGPVPQEVRDWFEVDLGNLGHPYPTGSETPEVEDLLPQVRGSTLVSSDSAIITVEVPSAYVEPEAGPEEMTYVVYRRGDLSVLEALNWRCQWANAYVDAKEKGDATSERQARTALDTFPEMEVLQGLPVAQNHREEMEPVLGGDVAAGREWLASKCVSR